MYPSVQIRFLLPLNLHFCPSVRDLRQAPWEAFYLLLQWLKEVWHNKEKNAKKIRYSLKFHLYNDLIKVSNKLHIIRDLPDIPELLTELHNIPVYMLINRSETKKEKPKDEIDRISNIQRCMYQMEVRFNDIIVCRTHSRTLDTHFQAVFGQIYNLQVSFNRVFRFWSVMLIFWSISKMSKFKDRTTFCKIKNHIFRYMKHLSRLL